MSFKALDLSNLAALDGGKGVEAFALHLRRAALDCYDRPGDDTTRKVTMEVLLKPRMEADGSCSEVLGQIKAHSSLPRHTTKVYSFGIKPNGTLMFNEDSPTSINQGSMLPDED